MRRAAAELHASLNGYLGEDNPNALASVSAIAAIQDSILTDQLFETVQGRREIPAWQANTTFLDLLSRLNDLSTLMSRAQDRWVWLRNWQWTVAVQASVFVRVGIEIAAVEMRDDAEQPADELLAYARGLYEQGAQMVADRSVDEALDVYVGARCLIIEVYNHAGLAAGRAARELGL